jgi:hypothetical protein
MTAARVIGVLWRARPPLRPSPNEPGHHGHGTKDYESEHDYGTQRGHELSEWAEPPNSWREALRVVNDLAQVERRFGVCCNQILDGQRQGRSVVLLARLEWLESRTEELDPQPEISPLRTYCGGAVRVGGYPELCSFLRYQPVELVDQLAEL